MTIKPYTKNAKKHPKKQLEMIAKSLARFGWQQPIKVGKDNVILVGHGRYSAYELFKSEYQIKVPWIVNENGRTISGEAETRKLTLAEEKAYRLADNQINAMSDIDMDIAIEDLKGMSDDLFSLVGFDKDVLAVAEDKDDEVPETPKRPVTKAGDLYEFGGHKLLCGDVTKGESVAKLMGDDRADMIFTDPPYNVDYTGMQNSKKWDKIANDAMTPELFQLFLEVVFKRYFEVSKDSAAIYICHADKSHIEFKKAFESIGYQWRATIVWVKNSPAFNFAQYKYSHEPIFYCVKKGKTVKWLGDNTNKTVWEKTWTDKQIIDWFKKESLIAQQKGRTTTWKAKKEHGDHPTIKPVELISRAVLNSSDRGDLIVDFFAGSGSTLITAEKLGRRCYAMELQPTYCDVIIQRWVDFQESDVYKIVKNGKVITWQKSKTQSKTQVKTKNHEPEV